MTAERTYTVAQGGLMRCCLQSLNDAHVADFDGVTADGFLECRWCSGRMTLIEGAWRWFPPVPAGDTPPVPRSRRHALDPDCTCPSCDGPGGA